jgi:hypothetical protein
VIVLNDGKITLNGKYKDLIKNPLFQEAVD